MHFRPSQSIKASNKIYLNYLKLIGGQIENGHIVE
jgi:hypothetical protein